MRQHVQRWIGTYQKEHLRQARISAIPLFLRVHAAALGSTFADGHAPFVTGELSTAVAPFDATTGVVQRAPDARELRRAIRRAAELGLLHHSSSVRCLRLPAHAVLERTGLPGDSRCSVPAHRAEGTS